MKLHQIVKELELEVKSKVLNLDKEVSSGYASDLLSDVIASAKKDSIWITLQIHQNIIGVAALKELAGIIIVNGRKPEAETLKKAEQENIPIMVTKLPAFEIIGKLYRLLR
ncbi:MAG: serine kinase [Candidatus Hydromicrobium americanum]|nr:MAG: serine kinase [Candidatus Hydromicrobium americanum]